MTDRQNIVKLKNIKQWPPDQVDKRVHFLQYINTGILTLILGFAMMIFLTVQNVKSEQSNAGKELIRLKTVQDNNVLVIGKVDARVNVLETNYVEALKNWIDANYIRKPQK